MSTIRVNNISTVGGAPSVATSSVASVGNRDDVAYGQFNKIAAQSFPSGYTTILLDQTTVSKNITLTSNALFFSVPSVYQITVGLRFGSAVDAWTSTRLYNATAGEVGTSYGTGCVSNDPGPVTFIFLADVSNTAVGYNIQMYRNGGTWDMATPSAGNAKAIVTTVIKVS